MHLKLIRKLFARLAYSRESRIFLPIDFDFYLLIAVIFWTHHFHKDKNEYLRKVHKYASTKIQNRYDMI